MFGDELAKQAAMANAYGGEGSMIRQATIQDRIALAVKQAEDRLVKVKRAKEILDKNPDLEELLNIMQSSNF